MAEELHLSLLGHLEVHRSGLPVTGFTSNKVQALLCYLAVTGRTHLRPALAGLLWGELPEASAHNNLRKALSILRRLLGPYLDIRRDSVAFDRESAYWLDVEAFEDGVGSAAGTAGVEGLEKAVALYRDDLLAGFYVHDAPAFEEWALAERARLRMLALEALHTLAVHYSRLGEEGRAAAMGYTTRLLALEPWREEAHRQLMLLLAAGGQRSAALAQYETCRRLLAEELGVEPDQETTALYESIREGQLSAQPMPPPQLETPAVLPGFLTGQASPVARPVFVGREKELAWLSGLLEEALSGRGQAAFVVGGPGRGKTVLLQEFARRALDAHPDLLVAMGTCNAYSGMGDPYLPFRTILAMLTGDAEGPWASGIVSPDQARRMWDALPEVAPVLARWGSGLVGTLLPGRELLGRARTAAPSGAEWLAALERLADPRTTPPGGLEQSHLLEQYTNVLLNLSVQHPLLLLLHDLQWTDMASVGLLFHLGRRIQGGRILLAGAYRPDELALERDGERHPLEPALAEFRARFGDAWLDLAAADEAGGRLFVDRLLDAEPNALDERFREALFRRTRGHALFTIELLRAMQQRGDLLQDPVGRWVQGDRLEWDALPARAEAAIAERFDRLPEELRQILAVASVEGEQFTAQTVALVQGMDELHTLRAIGQQLAVRHRLVREQGEIRLDERSLSRYRFSHFLVQQHVYQGLGDAERRLLHRRVGEALEQLYKGQLEEVAVELARHFTGDPEREQRYARLAGERAAARFANEEAVRYLARALELTPCDERRERYELLLARERVHDLLGQREAQRQCLAEIEVLVAAGRGLGTAEQGETLVRLGHLRRDTGARGEAWQHFEAALELARATGDRRLESRALEGLGRVRFGQRGYVDAERLWRESLALAREIGDETLQAVDARELGTAASLLGRPEEAANWAESSRALCEKNGDRHGLANALRSLGHLAGRQGDWDEAERCYGDSLALAEEIGDRRSYAATLRGLGNVSVSRHGVSTEAHAYFERSRAIAEEIGARGLLLGNLHSLSSLACQEGAYEEAEAYQKQAIALCREFRDPVGVASAQARLAYVLVLQGRTDAGWAALHQVLQDSTAPGMSAQAVSGIVAVVGQIGVHLGRFQRAAELLGLGFGLDPTRSDNETFAEPQLNVLRAILGAQELKAALARGAALDVDRVVADILACDTPEAFWSAGADETPPA